MAISPNTGKVFGCPGNPARCRCDGIEAVLPVLVHPGRLDRGWDTLGRQASQKRNPVVFWWVGLPCGF